MQKRFDEGADPGSAGPSTAPTIVIVEDEFLVRDMIVHEVIDAGFKVIPAETAEGGLQALKEGGVALLFTDIRLPGPMDGWQLAEAARELTPELPIIYATGYTAEEPRVVAGAVFLRKPYLPSQVISHINRLLRATA